jgi:hypothetical protein
MFGRQVNSWISPHYANKFHTIFNIREQIPEIISVDIRSNLKWRQWLGGAVYRAL